MLDLGNAVLFNVRRACKIQEICIVRFTWTGFR
jgi:hypothetical protein